MGNYIKMEITKRKECNGLCPCCNTEHKMKRTAKKILKDIIHGYENAGGEMWIPDYIDKFIEEGKELLK